MVAEAASIEKPADAPMVVSAASGAQTAPSSVPTKRDYGWLSEAILHRVEELKRYPASARVDRAEGKVVVKAVINEDGSIGEVEVFQSSGHPGLDKAAVETMRQAAPFHLPLPLGQPRMTIKIPMSYRLDR
jgi:protein TonB